jgi:hypothetical protein
MQIRYLKAAPLGNAGDVAEVIDGHALILIAVGLAEVYEPDAEPVVAQKQVRKPSKKHTDSE